MKNDLNVSAKRALVLGCQGQDGALISKSLLSKNYKVIGLSRGKNYKNNNLSKLGISSEIEHLEGDITDINFVKSLLDRHSPDEVYNLAAQSSVGKSFNQPNETIEGIVSGTINLLESARILGFSGSIFFAGSSEIFGLTTKKADINHPQNPINPYGVAKQASLNLVRIYRDSYDLKCVTGILFNHESSLRNDDFVTQKIIRGAIECSKNKNKKIKLGNINIQRDWGWAGEYVEAMQLISSAKVKEDFIICTGKLTKLSKFIDIAFKKFSLNWQDHIEIDETLFRKQEILKSYGDPYHLKSQLNWSAQFSIEKIIEILIEDKLKA